jgi:hypothetical protein
LNRCTGFCRPLPNHSATPPMDRPERAGPHVSLRDDRDETCARKGGRRPTTRTSLRDTHTPSARAGLASAGRAGLQALWVSFHDAVLEVGNVGRFDDPDGLQLDVDAGEVVEEPGPVAEHDRNDVELELVTRPAARNCWMTFAPPPIETSLPPPASLACSSAGSMPLVTNVNVVPPCFSSGWRR